MRVEIAKTKLEHIRPVLRSLGWREAKEGKLRANEEAWRKGRYHLIVMQTPQKTVLKIHKDPRLGLHHVFKCRFKGKNLENELKQIIATLRGKPHA